MDKRKVTDAVPGEQGGPVHSVLDDNFACSTTDAPHHARRRSHRQPPPSRCSHLSEKLFNIVSKKMFIFSLIAITQASTVGTTPCTALIGHERLDDNFAYSTAEAHAYADAWMANFQPAPIVGTHHAAQPIFQDVPVHASLPPTGTLSATRSPKAASGSPLSASS